MVKIESKSGPEMKDASLHLDLSLEQQKLLFGCLRSQLAQYVHHETRSHLTPDFKKEMDFVREIAGKIVNNLGYDKTYTPVDFITLGLADFISVKDLEELAARKAYGPMEEYFKAKVNFYLDKKRSGERRNLD